MFSRLEVIKLAYRCQGKKRRFYTHIRVPCRGTHSKKLEATQASNTGIVNKMMAC